MSGDLPGLSNREARFAWEESILALSQTKRNPETPIIISTSSDNLWRSEALVRRSRAGGAEGAA